MDVNNLTSAERETIIFEVLMMLRKSIPNIVRKTGILINQAKPVSIEDKGSYFKVTAYVRAVDYANKYIFLGPFYLNAKRAGNGWEVDNPEFDSGIDGCFYDIVGVNASHLKVYSHMVVIDEKALYLCDCASVSVTDATENASGTIRFDMKDGTSDTFVWDLTTQNIDFMNNFKAILDTMVSNAEPFDMEPALEEPAPASDFGPRTVAEEAPAASPAMRPAASRTVAEPNASQQPFRPAPSPAPTAHSSAPAFKRANDSEGQSAFRTVGSPDKKRETSFLQPHREKTAPGSVEEEFDSFLKEDASSRPVFKPVFQNQNQTPVKEEPKAAPASSSSPFKPLGGASQPAPAANSPFKPIGSTPEPAAPASNSPFKPLSGASQSAPAANSPFKPIGSTPEPAAPASDSPFKPLGGASQSAPASSSPFKPFGGSSEQEKSPFAPAPKASRPSARPAASSQPSGNPNFQSPFSSAAQNTKTAEDGTVLRPMTAESLAHIDDLKPVRSVVSSPEEEVEKYRRLLSIGAITADEFELKKRQLIGD